MTRPDFQTLPDFHRGYVDHVKDLDVYDALNQSLEQTVKLIKSIPEAQGEYRYAEGKWSIKEVIAHMIDTERILAYRSMRFARNDKTELPGFEENNYAPEANAHARTIEQMAGEFERIRQVSIDLFKSFTGEMLKREGTANKLKLSVLNLGYIIAGHALHHRRILMERYLKK
jgi:hypothetical protein